MEPYVHCQPPIVFNELHNIDISGIYERPNANNTGVSSELSLYNHIVGIVWIGPFNCQLPIYYWLSGNCLI